MQFWEILAELKVGISFRFCAPWEILDQPNVPDVWSLAPICENYFQGVKRRVLVKTEESKSFQLPDKLTKQCRIYQITFTFRDCHCSVIYRTSCNVNLCTAYTDMARYANMHIYLHEMPEYSTDTGH